MRSLDRVSEAYYGSMGESFARKTRERIHWICSKAQGKQVLDIGCSQGITAILLAREGKKVIGIDIEEEAIKFANEALMHESETVKRNVQYLVCSIFDFQSDQLFDTIILTEVLEHFSNSSSLLEHVKSMLAYDGTLIITVPFGINDFIDHKKTYYLINLIDEIEPFFQVIEVKFFGKWIGIVSKKQQEITSFFNKHLIRELEQQFYLIERNLTDELTQKSNKIKELSKQYTDAATGNNELKKKNAQLQEQLAELQKRIDDLSTYKKLYEDLLQTHKELNNKIVLYKDSLDEEKRKHERTARELNELKSQFEAVSSQYETTKDLESQIESQYKQKIAQLEQIIEEKNQEILKRLESEEDTLKKYKNMIFQYNQLEARYAQISNKYKLLSNAKLGRLTLKYWKIRKRIPEDF